MKRLEKISIAIISKFETASKENKELLNVKIDKKVRELNSEASSSINKTFSPLNSNNSPSSYKQPSAVIIKWPILKSPDFHSHAPQFGKHLLTMTLEGDTLFQIQKWWDVVRSAFFQSITSA